MSQQEQIHREYDRFREFLKLCLGEEVHIHRGEFGDMLRDAAEKYVMQHGMPEPKRLMRARDAFEDIYLEAEEYIRQAMSYAPPDSVLSWGTLRHLAATKQSWAVWVIMLRMEHLRDGYSNEGIYVAQGVRALAKQKHQRVSMSSRVRRGVTK